jgi:ABC-type multidrug transport system fused ATPase/permease subunit
LAVVAAALQMLLPVFTQVIVDRVLVEQDVGLLNMVVLTMLVALAFMTVATVVQRYLLSFTAVRIDSATLDYLSRWRAIWQHRTLLARGFRLVRQRPAEQLVDPPRVERRQCARWLPRGGMAGLGHHVRLAESITRGRGGGPNARCGNRVGSFRDPIGAVERRNSPIRAKCRLASRGLRRTHGSPISRSEERRP